MSGARAVVVGAGHNGLVCAVRLAAAGLAVTVVEAGEAPGGGVRSHAETLPGFIHDTCAGFFPLTVASPALGDLPLGVDWIDPAVPMAHPFLDGSAIALHRDLGATCASLDAAVPGAGASWRALVELLRPHSELLSATVLSRLPPIAPAGMLAARLRTHTPRLLRRGLGSAAALGDDLFGGGRPAAWLAGSAAHSDLAPHARPGGALALGLALLGHVVGWPYPRGGAQQLTDALVAHLGELGGELRCGAPVATVELSGRRASAVRLASGERLPADAVVASVSAGVLSRLLPQDALPARVERRLRHWRYGLGTFKLDLALSGPVPWTAAEARAAAVVHVGGELSAFERAWREAAANEVPREPVLVAGQHSLGDASRAPAGSHTLYVYTHLPRRPAVDDDAIVDRVERQIERFAPGFRELILARAVRSPTAIERENPSMVGGDLGGGTFALDQQLFLRPSPRLVRGRTPIRGLYVAGASVHPGGGVHGVSGDAAARAVLADASPFRPWR